MFIQRDSSLDVDMMVDILHKIILQYFERLITVDRFAQ